MWSPLTFSSLLRKTPWLTSPGPVRQKRLQLFPQVMTKVKQTDSGRQGREDLRANLIEREADISGNGETLAEAWQKSP